VAATCAIDLSDVQGGILHGYRLEHAVHLSLHAGTTEAARRCLARLLDEGVTNAVRPDSRPSSTLNVAITYAGFRMLGLSPVLLDRFPLVFRQEARARAASLGDVGVSDPQNWEAHSGTGHVQMTVTAYADSAALLDERTTSLRELLTDGGEVEVLPAQQTHALPQMVEHFGFADGGSQPCVEGVPVSDPTRSTVAGGGIPVARSDWRPVKLGEFILGYADEDGHVAEDPTSILVRNGSYVVHRKLVQDVVAFEASLDRAAAESGLPRELVAAKVIGRWRDGVPLVLSPSRSIDDDTDLSKAKEPAPANDFRYLPHDRDGFACPHGAHIRRVNPRDAIVFGDRVHDTGRLTARHRIIRRGMPFGAPLDAGILLGSPEKDQERGLMFICYNADIERQFETIQRAWCTDGDAFYLGEDQDFLLANERSSGKMTIPVRGAPPKFITAPADLVVTRSMEYLFAPSIRALHRLAAGRFS
jgi:Dyp-type peroxidase family